MLNFLITTDKDRKEAALIDRRRTLEAERKKRIFNPRERLFGIDYEALDKQIAEKKRRDEEERRIDEFYARQMRNYDEIAIASDTQARKERKAFLQELNDFRRNYQKPEDRREFDLSDPDLHTKLIAARLTDDDPRCGPSSAQKFEGEDLSSEERAAMQKEQLKAWLDQQLMEREAADKEHKAAENAYKAAIIARDQRAIELENMEKQCKRRLELACINYNKALAEERCASKREEDRKNEEDNLAEMCNILTSNMMTENPDVSQSNLGPGRHIGYLYKGMTPEEKAECRALQLAQIEEMKAKKVQEERYEREWQDYNNDIQKSILLRDLDLEKQKRERERELAEENKRMSIEQKNHKEYMNKVVFTNRPTADYFAQFNSSTR